MALGEMADQVRTGNRKCEKGSWAQRTRKWKTLEMKSSLISPGQVCAVWDVMSAGGGSLPHFLAELCISFASYVCTAMYLSRPSTNKTGAAIFNLEFFLCGPDCMSGA